MVTLSAVLAPGVETCNTTFWNKDARRGTYAFLTAKRATMQLDRVREDRLSNRVPLLVFFHRSLDFQSLACPIRSDESKSCESVRTNNEFCMSCSVGVRFRCSFQECYGSVRTISLLLVALSNCSNICVARACH